MEAVLVALALITLAAIAAALGLAMVVRRLVAQRDAAVGDASELRGQLAGVQARLEAVEGERDRLLEERPGEQELTGELTGMRESIGDLISRVDGTKEELAKTSNGVSRIDGHITGFTARLANPQSRGAFGEEALRNQLELLGLAEGRDFRRQVKEAGGRRRIDYAVTLRGATIGIDPKFALDPDLEGVSEALAAGDDDRLRPFARKLVDRAKELARKEYWAHLERSPGFVLMYVPIEGAQAVFSALPEFSYEKFALEHGVYLVTPLQLGTTLGVIADVAHSEKRSEEIEETHGGLVALDQEMAKFSDLYAKHGRHLATAVSSYNAGGAMLSPRGGLGRMVKRLRGYSRRLFARPEEPRFEPVREDVEEIAAGYEAAAAELRESA
jgi:DNA recombination protein RmuC